MDKITFNLPSDAMASTGGFVIKNTTLKIIKVSIDNPGHGVVTIGQITPATSQASDTECSDAPIPGGPELKAQIDALFASSDDKAIKADEQPAAPGSIAWSCKSDTTSKDSWGNPKPRGSDYKCESKLDSVNPYDTWDDELENDCSQSTCSTHVRDKFADWTASDDCDGFYVPTNHSAVYEDAADEDTATTPTMTAFKATGNDDEIRACIAKFLVAWDKKSNPFSTCRIASEKDFKFAIAEIAGCSVFCSEVPYNVRLLLDNLKEWVKDWTDSDWIMARNNDLEGFVKPARERLACLLMKPQYSMCYGKLAEPFKELWGVSVQECALGNHAGDFLSNVFDKTFSGSVGGSGEAPGYSPYSDGSWD